MATKGIVVLPYHRTEDQAEENYIHPEVEFTPPDLTLQRLNDHGNAQRFTAMFGADVHYSVELKRWLLWDGCRWKVDIKNQILAWARTAMKEFLDQAADSYNREMLRFAVRSLDAPRLRNLLLLVQSEPAVAVELAQFDRHPMVINFANGTFNLATGELDSWRRDDLLTQMIDVAYEPDAPCQCWIRFLSEILEPEVIRYLQKALGYCLSGSPTEKAIFICFGAADAGKTTLLSIIRDLLSEYSTLLQASTLVGDARNSNGQSDLADLRGKRFVQVSEFGSDEQLAQKVLKGICQGTGGRLKAIPKYANAIQFDETWVVWLDSNPLPRLGDPYDPGVRVRFHPILFAKSVPLEKRDRTLHGKLRGEFPGILTWLIEGFRLYQAEGLKRPSSVVASLNAWFEESDHIPQFVAQRCVLGKRFSIEPKPLFDAYKTWCEKSAEKPVSTPVFSRGMQHHGYPKGRETNRRFYAGLKLAKLG